MTNLMILKAFLIDGYRELNSKKMFWLVMIGSGLVAGLIGAIGLTEEGMTVFGGEFKNPMINLNVYSPQLFYVGTMFSYWGVEWWLTFFAMILAIVSTGSLMPEFMSKGTVDLVLCKPISRTKLFFIKYLSGFLFVFFQILVFTFACYLVIGFRADIWSLDIFITIPFVMLFFSYFYCVSVLLASFGRGTLACILLTLLFWCIMGAFNLTHDVMSTMKTAYEVEEQFYEEALKEQIEPEEREEIEKQVAKNKQERETFNTAYKVVSGIKMVFPKNDETAGLISRYLVDYTAIEQMHKNRQTEIEKDTSDMKDESPSSTAAMRNNDDQVATRLEKNEREKSAFSIIGSSLLFEAVILALACWRFSRKDF